MSEPLVFVAPQAEPEETNESAPSLKVAGRSDKKSKPRPTDSNRYTDKAKRLVVDNYNSHHDSDRTPPLTIELVYIVYFTKIQNNWQALVGSTVVKGLLYMVTYNGDRSEAYLDVFKKINNVKIAD